MRCCPCANSKETAGVLEYYIAYWVGGVTFKTYNVSACCITMCKQTVQLQTVCKQSHAAVPFNYPNTECTCMCILRARSCSSRCSCHHLLAMLGIDLLLTT
jgi:hypothetical protein